MPALIGEDFKIRALVRERFRLAAVSWVGIERSGPYLRVNIHKARPGVVIGRRGADIEAVRAQIEKLTSRKTFINVMEIKEPELDARLVAEAIALQLERRIAHRRAIRRALERTMQAGALGIKVEVKGRLGGAEIARREWQREARVPLHTFSADIDYGLVEARTPMGTIGVKVWIFKKQLIEKTPAELLREAKAEGQVIPVGEAAPAVQPAPRQAEPASQPAESRRPEVMPDLPPAAMAQLMGEDVPGYVEPPGGEGQAEGPEEGRN